MKVHSDHLFRLVKSLSGQEKRFFKLSARRNERGVIYLKLFDALDGLKEYDEKKLLLVLSKTGGIKSLKQFKGYLQEAILRFLESHHADHSIETQLQRLLQRIELLHEKRLFDLARKTVQKAEKLAEEHHHYLNLLKILDWKREIMMRESDLAALKEREHYLSEMHCINSYRNVIDYQKIYAGVIAILATSPDNPDEKAKAELKDILRNPFLQDEKNALSFPAGIVRCRILGDAHLLLGNWKESCFFLQRATRYFEPAHLSPGTRLAILSRLIIPLRELKKSGELLLVQEVATKLVRSLPKKSQTVILYASYISLMNNLTVYQLSVFNAGEALSISNEIRELVEKYALPQSFLVYYSNRLEIFLLAGDHHKALSCVHKILAVEKAGIRLDIISHTKIIALVIHYELGNMDILPNLCASATRYFNKRKQSHRIEEIMIRFFDQVAGKISTRKEQTKAFLNLKRDLELYQSEKIHFHFDFISWAESKIQNRPMVEILKEKSLKG